MTKKLLMGNEAMAHAALEAGVGVVAGYPGTPSSEIVETIARERARGAAHGVHVEWSTNEKVALELLFGASLAGKRALFTCKQMGLNVASDALMSLNYVSVRGGLVLIVADDPGPISSQTEQDTRRFASFAKVPVLDPSTPEQACQMVKAAFELSEHFHTPVIVRPTTRIDHASTFFEVEEETFALPALEGGFQCDPSKWVIFPGRSYEAHREINERLVDMAGVFSAEPTFASFNPMEESGESFSGRPTYGILAGGVSAAYVREALRIVTERAVKAGIGVPSYRFMQVGTPYPFPEKLVSQFVTGLSNVLVIEELDCVLEDELAMMSGRLRASFAISGKRTGDARDRGENDIDDITARIERFLGLTGRLSLHRLRGGANREPAPIRLSPLAESELPSRPPVLCAGCPHRGAFYAVKQAIGDDPVVMCGDIGCYTLGNAQPLDAVDTCLCMGAGITMAQGFAVADPDKKAIAYVGDSTFFASGMPGVANAAYNGHDITVMVLDNATTAMTGSQPHPGTGRTLMGKDNRPLDIEMVLVANGFGPIYHANPFDRDASVIAVRAAVGYEGPSAVIFEGPCIQLVKPKPPVVINSDVCTGCKRCITGIGCPAISFNASIAGPRSRGRGQAVVDPSLCTGCGLCTQVCPFHAILADPSVLRSAQASRMIEAESVGLTRLAGARRVVKTEDVFGWEDADEAAGVSGEGGAFVEGVPPAAFDEGFDDAFGGETRLAQLPDEMGAAADGGAPHDGGEVLRDGGEAAEVSIDAAAAGAEGVREVAGEGGIEGGAELAAPEAAHEAAPGEPEAAPGTPAAPKAAHEAVPAAHEAAPDGAVPLEAVPMIEGVQPDDALPSSVTTDGRELSPAGVDGLFAQEAKADRAFEAEHEGAANSATRFAESGEGAQADFPDEPDADSGYPAGSPDAAGVASGEAPHGREPRESRESRESREPAGMAGAPEGAVPDERGEQLHVPLALDFGEEESVVEVQPADGYDEFDAMFDAFKDEPSSSEEGGLRD